MPAPWTPWETYHVEGFGPVVRVEIAVPIAAAVLEEAKRRGMSPEAVLNAALAGGLARLAAIGSPDEEPKDLTPTTN